MRSRERRRRSSGRAGEPQHDRRLLRAGRPVHALGRRDLGRQHTVPARRRPELLRGLPGQRGVLARDGAVRDPDRRDRGHAGSARVLPAQRDRARCVDARVRGAGGGGCRRPRLRGRVRPDGGRVHVLLGSDGGPAGRRPERLRLPGPARPGLRARPAGDGRRDARRHDRRRAARPGGPEPAVSRPLGAPPRGLRSGVRRHARRRLHAPTCAGARAPSRGCSERACRSRIRMGPEADSPGDARRGAGDRVLHVGLLRVPAVPPGAARQRRGLGRRGRDRGDSAVHDRGEPGRAGRLALLREADDAVARRGECSRASPPSPSVWRGRSGSRCRPCSC